MADKDKESRDEQRRKTITAAGIGVGLGIGSAALAAALIYSRSGGKPKKDGDDKPPKTSTAPKTDIQGGNHWTD